MKYSRTLFSNTLVEQTATAAQNTRDQLHRGSTDNDEGNTENSSCSATIRDLKAVADLELEGLGGSMYRSTIPAFQHVHKCTHSATQHRPMPQVQQCQHVLDKHYTVMT